MVLFANQLEKHFLAEPSGLQSFLLMFLDQLVKYRTHRDGGSRKREKLEDDKQGGGAKESSRGEK